MKLTDYKTDSFLRTFKFAGGYKKASGEKVPTDYSTLVVEVRDLFTFISRTKSGRDYALMPTSKLVDLSNSIERIIEELESSLPKE